MANLITDLSGGSSETAKESWNGVALAEAAEKDEAVASVREDGDGASIRCLFKTRYRYKHSFTQLNFTKYNIRELNFI
jgi:hypothetical protein